MEWVETMGRTVEDAKDAALDRLGIPADDAEFEVVSEARMGLFGRLKEEARVRARVRPATPRAKEPSRRRRGSKNGGKGSGRGGDGRRNEGKAKDGGQGNKAKKSGQGDKARNGGQRDKAKKSGQGDKAKGGGQGRGGKGRDAKSGDGRSKRGGRDDQTSSSRDNGSNERKDAGRTGPDRKEDAVDDRPSLSLMEQADLAESFVQGLAERFGTSLTFSRDEMVDDILRIEATGDNIGALVGHRGATAQSIDELVRTVLQRAGGTTREGKIRVDVGGVRARRATALAGFTRAQAERVLESGNEIVFEPMGGADRKVVHDTASEIVGVSTRSQGEEPNRCVVLVPESDAD